MPGAPSLEFSALPFNSGTGKKKAQIGGIIWHVSRSARKNEQKENYFHDEKHHSAGVCTDFRCRLHCGEAWPKRHSRNKPSKFLRGNIAH
jgi:hypothetical protein